MSGHHSEQRRQDLEAERDRIKNELADLGLGPAGGLDYDQNFADSSQVTAERGEAEALAGELTETLENVEAALVRLDAGTYGTCERCGQEIAADRLDAMPMANHCMACAALV